ncbi:homolog of Synechocystis YCF37 [Striga asiatica]|uniref:Homolog of Synechocystis YCF37 n=1 Tax=Striga asiatica TaxID=4170 RepID=A0A5A7PEV7_STRAF|nr:homolog of Synechocystis YCF37 [Striga asiatica]
MASTTSSIAALALPAHPSPQPAHARKHAPVALPTRRHCLVLLTAATAALTAVEMPAGAQDIPLFGLRRGLRKAEEEAEQIVKEGFEAVDRGMVAAEKGIEAAEKGVVTAEKEIESAEKGIEEAVSFGGLAQASAVAGAEVVGVLVATSVVNGILGPEARKS